MEHEGSVSPVLELQDVTFRYPRGAAVLDGLDLAVRPAERLALLGANGSGKTTLLRLLVGLGRPDSGRMSLDGRPIGDNRDERTRLRTAVQLVLQEPDDQIVAATVRADVSFGPMNLGLPREEVVARVDEAMAAMDITDLADRPPHHLSFGQRKRVAIAGAMAMRPEVLLLDEASAGLDPRAVRNLMDRLDGFADTGTAVIMATHDVDVAWSWATEALVLSGGKLHRGPIEDVLADHALLDRAHLTMPWGAAISRRLNRTVRHPSQV